MKLIVGLGNPGEKYNNTRHNVGFRVVDLLVQERGLSWKTNKRLQVEVAKGDNFVLAKPLTFMNNSGIAVKKLMTNYKCQMPNLYLIHDDIDLLLGKIKIAKNRGAAGHHGVESVIEHLKSKDFNRIRLGIGLSRGDPVDFVLNKFEREERVEVNKMVEKTIKIIQFALENDLEPAIDRY